MNHTTQKMGQTMQSASSKASSGMSSMSGAANEVANSATKVENATRKAAEAAERSGSAAEKAAQKWKQLGEQYGTTSKKATMMMSNLDHASGAIQTIGAAGTAMGGGIAFGFTKAVKTVMQFDDSMSAVRAKTGATGAVFEALRNEALRLGSTTSFTSSQAADAMDKLAMAGWSTEKILSGTEHMLNLAAAGGLDLARAADIASDIMTPFQISADQAGRVADVLAKAATSANTSVELLGETMKYTAPIASTYGMSLEQTTAIAAKMADAGIKGSEAGTAMRAGLTRLAAPPKEAQEALDKLGVKTNIKGKMRPIFDVLADIEAKFKTLSQAEQIAASKAIFGQEAMSGWMSILSTGSTTMKEYTQKLLDSGGAAKQMAEIMNDNIGGAFRELGSAVEGAAIAIGDQVKEPVRKVAEGITWLVTKFNELNPTTKKIIAFSAVITSALLLLTGPFLILLALIPGIADRFARIASIFGMTSTAMLGTMGTVLLVVGAIAALGIAFVALYKKSETFRNFVNGLFNSISKTVDAAVKQITDLAKGLWGYILVWWQEDGEKIRSAAHKIIDPLKKMWHGLSDVAKPAFEELKNIVFYVWKAIEDQFYSGLDIILGAISIFADIINGDFSGAWNTVKAKILEVWESIKQKTSSAIESIKTTVSDWVNTAIDTGKKFLSGIAKGFMDGVDTVVAAAKSVWEKIKSVFTGEEINVTPNVQYDRPAGPPVPPTLLASPGYRAYASGGLIDRPHLGLVGEAGPEMIIPLSASRRGRGLELWQQAGQILGAIPYANGGLVGGRSVPERQKPSKPPKGLKGGSPKGNNGRGARPIQNIFHISITGDQVAAIGEDKEYMRKIAREMVEEFAEKIIDVLDNYTVDNLGTMMES
ncbi:phage tail tape measure protein [Aneurinibacillus thermoaerophilus]|uniref:phage tail tape measure protein n=2 Tax=Aneurinibacillus thermoaerophilus TaxID=143495 RepID=UPI002E1E274F|nr:phage tail tape measure protein [Aneurinibacillus thermoaerophilus]MED0766338.1 phage tail tape measure protein [Aneurinibacillus thermoaerophilus]